MSEYEWINNLEIGDKVFVKRSLSDDTKTSVGTISKITKTQIHTKHSKFRKSDGWLVGQSSYVYTRIEEFNSELYSKLIEEKSKKRIIEYIKSANYDNISLKDLYEIEELIKSKIEKGESDAE